MPWMLLAGGVGLLLYFALKKSPEEAAAEAARNMMQKPQVVARVPGATSAAKYQFIYGAAMDLLTRVGVLKSPAEIAAAEAKAKADAEAKAKAAAEAAAAITTYKPTATF